MQFCYLIYPVRIYGNVVWEVATFSISIIRWIEFQLTMGLIKFSKNGLVISVVDCIGTGKSYESIDATPEPKTFHTFFKQRNVKALVMNISWWCLIQSTSIQLIRFQLIFSWSIHTNKGGHNCYTSINTHNQFCMDECTGWKSAGTNFLWNSIDVGCMNIYNYWQLVR